MTDKIMKRIVFLNLITCICCLLGTASCSELVSENQYAGDDIQLGITDDIEIYPLGGSLTIPSYYEGSILLNFIPENDGDNWLFVPQSVGAGEDIVITAEENRGREMRVGKLSIIANGSKELTVFQDVMRVEPGVPSDLKLPGAKDTVFISCLSNVNYRVTVDEDEFSYMSSDSLRNYSAQNDGGFYLAVPMGALNEERLLRLPINALDVYGNEVLKRSVDVIEIRQEPYYMQFKIDNVPTTELTMDSGNCTQPFVFKYSGPWTIWCEDQSWARIKLNGEELTDGTHHKLTSEHDVVSEMELEVSANTSLERATEFVFTTDFDGDEIDDMEVVLNVRQKGI